MNFEEYEKRAAMTAVYPNELTESFGPAYIALGLCGESDELIRAEFENELDEGSDVLWYVSQEARELGLTLQWPTTTSVIFPNPKQAIQAQACRIAELVKKVYRNKHGVFDKDTKARIQTLLTVILICLADVAKNGGVTLQDIAELNLKKLEHRDNANEIKERERDEEKDFIEEYLK